MLGSWLRGIGGSVVGDGKGKSKRLQEATICHREMRWIWKKSTTTTQKATLDQPDRQCLAVHPGRILLHWNEVLRPLAKKSRTRMRRKRHETGGSASSTATCDYLGHKSAPDATRLDLFDPRSLVHWNSKLCSILCRSLATFKQFLWIPGDTRTPLTWIYWAQSTTQTLLDQHQDNHFPRSRLTLALRPMQRDQL